MVDYQLENYTLTAVDKGTDGQITQITSQSIDPGLQQLLVAADSELDVTYTGIIKSAPRITFTTTDVKAALDMATIQGLAFATGGQPLTLWFMKRAPLGVAAGSVHIKMVIDDGLLVCRAITANDGSPASVDLEIIPVDNDLANDPVLITNSDAGPTITAPGVTDLWTVGPWVINGDSVQGLISSVSIDPAINVNTVSGGGIYPRLVQVTGRAPVITGTIGHGRALIDMGLTGLVLTGVTRVYLRKLVQGGAVDADANATHIEFDVAEGMVTTEQSSGSHGEDATFNVKIQPTFDGTNDAIAVDTVSLINSI